MSNHRYFGLLHRLASRQLPGQAPEAHVSVSQPLFSTGSLKVQTKQANSDSFTDALQGPNGTVRTQHVRTSIPTRASGAADTCSTHPHAYSGLPSGPVGAFIDFMQQDHGRQRIDGSGHQSHCWHVMRRNRIKVRRMHSVLARK